MQAPTKLLQDDDPAPVHVLRESGASDFLLTADHAGRAIPRCLGQLGLPEHELSRHIAWDIGIRDVTTQIADKLGATYIYQRYSRLVIDCNRKPDVAQSIAEVARRIFATFGDNYLKIRLRSHADVAAAHYADVRT